MKRIAIIIGLCALAIVSINMLFTKSVSSKNSIIIRGHFQSIIKQVAKGENSYDIYIQENDKLYKISADYSGCFQHDNFRNAVSTGQLIQISLCDNELLRKPFVASLIVGNIDYISKDCINAKISDNKLIPIGSFVFIVIMTLYLIYNKDDKAMRNRR